MQSVSQLLGDIRKCTHCQAHLPFGPRPIVSFSEKSKIWIIGQAPGSVVHENGVPWQDQSGKRLRQWLGVDEESFYDPDKFGILPMGFCYPGKGKGGDLPPRPECAPLWHQQVMDLVSTASLSLLIGQYAQKYYLGKRRKKNLTQTVQAYPTFLPEFFPLPHPSPRNRIWLAKNDWFEMNVVPELQLRVQEALAT